MLRALVLFAGMGLVPPLGPASASIVLTAPDGVKVYARAYAAANANAPVLLLFHQAGSSKSEYDPIAPQLAGDGYNVLAIDQRSGGDLYPPGNETVEHLGASSDYMSAFGDLEAALLWAKRAHPGAPIYALGSSYSAALVFILAARYPHDVAAVLAFSPGEYLSDKHAVHEAARHVRAPVFIDSSSERSEIEAARSIYNVIPSAAKTQYVPTMGIHGASTLREDRDPAGAQANWDALNAFLRSLPRSQS
jgi:dienelactone hydrolase